MRLNFWMAAWVLALTLRSQSTPQVLNRPPLLESASVSELRALGLTGLADDRSNLRILDADPRPEWLAVVQGDENCTIKAYIWRNGEFHAVDEMSCMPVGGYPNVVRARRAPSAEMDAEWSGFELVAPLLSDWAVLVSVEPRAPPSLYTYFAFSGDRFVSLIELFENERIERFVEIPGMPRPDLIVSGGTFACHWSAPAYWRPFKTYYRFVSEREGWAPMYEVVEPSGQSTVDAQMLGRARAAIQDGNRDQAVKNLTDLLVARPGDPAVLRNIEYTRLNVPRCGEMLNPRRKLPPMEDALEDADEESEVWTVSAIEGNGEELLIGLRSNPLPEIFTPGYAKRQFNSRGEDREYLGCVMGRLQESPDNFCERGDPGRWFIYGWTLYQSGKPAADYLPAFEKAAALAPKDAYYRKALAFVRAGKFPPPLPEAKFTSEE